MDSLWRAMSVVEGGQGTNEEAKEVRARVVAAVEERLQRGYAGAPAAGGDGMEGVGTEAGTREKDGRTAGD